MKCPYCGGELTPGNLTRVPYGCYFIPFHPDKKVRFGPNNGAFPVAPAGWFPRLRKAESYHCGRCRILITPDVGPNHHRHE